MKAVLCCCCGIRIVPPQSPAPQPGTDQKQRKTFLELMAQKYSIPSLRSWKKFRLLREVVKTTRRVEEELPQIRRPQVSESWLALANDFLSSHFLPPKVVPTFHMPSHGFSADVAEHLLFSVAPCPWIFAEQGKAVIQREPLYSCSAPL